MVVFGFAWIECRGEVLHAGTVVVRARRSHAMGWLKRIPAIVFTAALVGLLQAPVDAQQEGRRPPPRPIGQHYGPWNRDLEAYVSVDGRRFEYQGIFVERGGVPNLLQATDGRLIAVFQWFPLERPEAFDRIAVRSSENGGQSWSDPEPITINGAPKDIHRAFDPTVVPFEDGRFRLYFASERVSHGGGRGQRAIFSATSSDGVQFEFEPDQRFGFDDAEAYDPAVVYFQGRWHLFCPGPVVSSAYHAVSADGLEFATLDDITLPGSHTWIGNAIQAGSEIRFYGSGPNGIWLATSSNGTEWKLAGTIDLVGGDPAVVRRQDGTYLAVVTGELREDAVAGPPSMHR